VGVAVAGLLIETSSPQTSFAVGGGLLILTLPMLFLTRGQPLRVP
jgi:hypothetical protein